MKLIIIRHGDPNYEIDSLTPKGWREAELLSERISKLDVKAFYMSPLRRAKDTASLTLKKMKREAEILPWMREFEAPITDPYTGSKRIPWDMLPEDWTAVNDYYDKDSLLLKHGYKRNGNIYEAISPNNDTVVLFCHFGVECVMLGHLLGISPIVLWHGLCAAPTSVTTLITEERRKGKAYFRMNAFGDISHLYAAGEPPAFAARFCEAFDNKDERHD